MRLVRCAADNEIYQNYAVIYFRFSRQNITEMRSYYIEMHEYSKRNQIWLSFPRSSKTVIHKTKKMSRNHYLLYDRKSEFVTPVPKYENHKKHLLNPF